MSSPIITSKTLTQIAAELEKDANFKGDSISYEVQDDGNHLLVLISLDRLLEGQSPSAFKHAGEIVNSLVPGRVGDYSWMVVFTKNGQVIDSYFGGDLNCPDSGL